MSKQLIQVNEPINKDTIQLYAPNSSRIKFIDGLRGLAILLVLFVHSYVCDFSLLPEMKEYSSFIIFKGGMLGVELFFMISGFVILMTLEKCKNIIEFGVRRWIRLFPAMLVASCFIFATAPIINKGVQAELPKLLDVIPGLTFIGASLWSIVLGQSVTPLSGVFWSLFTEVKFYVIFGVLYFALGKKRAVNGLNFIFIITVLIGVLSKFASLNFAKIYYIAERLDFPYFGWFAVGAMMYLYFIDNNKNYIFYSVIIGMISAWHTVFFYIDFANPYIMAFLIAAVFVCSVFYKPIQKVLESKFILFIGYISYPLYLIHMQFLPSAIIYLHKEVSFIPVLLLPVIPVAILCLISYIIAKYIEPPMQKSLRNLFGPILGKENIYLFGNMDISKQSK